MPKIIAAVLVSIEEFLEMSGIVVFIYALLAYIGTYVGTTVQVRLVRSGNVERGATDERPQGARSGRVSEKITTEAKRTGRPPDR